mmetsp:Transcript_41516/g.81895  ORF Transcript_41516/g.81895 Transcript_41516/m.81895 type:complete len:127 (+) Transcript_41516:311-691(+)
MIGGSGNDPISRDNAKPKGRGGWAISEREEGRGTREDVPDESDSRERSLFDGSIDRSGRAGPTTRGAGGGGGGRGASVGVEAVLVRPVQMETGAPPPPIFNTDGFYADLQSRLEAQREALARIAKG